MKKKKKEEEEPRGSRTHTSLKYFFLPTEWRCREKGILVHLVGMHFGDATLEAVWGFLKKFK